MAAHAVVGKRGCARSAMTAAWRRAAAARSPGSRTWLTAAWPAG